MGASYYIYVLTFTHILKLQHDHETRKKLPANPVPNDYSDCQ